MNIQRIDYQEIDSTNLEAARLATGGAAEGTLVVAKTQTAGRGRRGRQWDSPEGDAIYMSLILRPQAEAADVSGLTLVMALSVAQALQQLQLGGVQIKWPNDIVLNRKKLCGILTELHMENRCVNDVIIGVGINVNQKCFASEIESIATSILIETGSGMDKDMLIDAVMEAFERNYAIYQKTYDMTNLMEDYQAFLANCNQEVRVLNPKGEYEGIALGINLRGELLVRKQDGTIETVYAGEVSVRGIYGYI
ncbi:MAG: biotin--[acetyl-CoA-carboxylase] ligase [Lachnospiraceae bacterium]|nr:biotin--[acetyl-CoA-carboxylase] ligase [Lachnospiraceae bacterium]